MFHKLGMLYVTSYKVPPSESPLSLARFITRYIHEQSWILGAYSYSYPGNFRSTDRFVDIIIHDHIRDIHIRVSMGPLAQKGKPMYERTSLRRRK